MTETYRHHRTAEEISLIKQLRHRFKPAQIAEILGTTKGAIDQILHREKLKGASYPKLRHGLLKYDCKKAQEWRDMIRSGLNYRKIKQIQGVHPAAISRTLAAEGRGELRW